MSSYSAFWYKGIIKEKYRRDIAAVFNAEDWSAVLSDDLKTIIAHCSEHSSYSPTQFCGFPYHFDPVITENGYDEPSGLLVLGQEWNTYGDMNTLMMNIDDVILPLITERIISYHCWQEPLTEAESDAINTDMLPQFERFMQKYSKMIENEGVEAIIKNLFR
ncbi:MAG: hypothetical protein IK990_04080 [Ruminiclostridium sp.]|nr:hypothetical protein [Ruminiclostridium sp.]